VSERPLPNPTHSRQSAKRLRRRKNRLARRLLDEAFAEYLRELAPQNDNNQSNSSNMSVPFPPPPPHLLSPSPNEVSLPPCSPTPPLIEPDSPHSVLTSRIFPDFPPSIHSLSPSCYSPIHSPEEPHCPSSPANSTRSSVEFIDEVPILPPRPRYYYYYDPHQSLDTLILQFPQLTTPLPLIPSGLTISKSGRLSRIRTQTQSFPSFFPFSPFLMKFLYVSFTIFSLPR